MSGRPSILHTDSSCGWGGQELRILTESRGLIARGWPVEIAATPGSPLLREAARFGVPAHAVPLERKRVAGMVALRRLLVSRRFDVLNAHSHTDALLAALACASLAAPPRLVRSRHISAPIGRSPLNRWIYARVAQAVVTTGQSIRRHVIEQTGARPERVWSVPTGVDPARYAPGDRLAARATLGLPGQETFIVGIVATLRSWKGHRFLLDALARMRGTPAGTRAAATGAEAPGAAPDLLLAVVGDGPQRPALEAQAHALGIADGVRFAGNRDDVEQWLQAFDLFALPSTGNEGVPQGLVQAMMAGLPCVTTSAGSIGELVEHGRTGWIVPAEDAGALAEAIGRLRADARLRAALGEQARAHAVAHHGLGAMLSRMEAVFACAARGEPPRMPDAGGGPS